MLKGLRLEGDAVPDPGPVHRGEREAGRLTSAALSPALGGVIALGYLRRGAEAAGTEVEIVREGRSRKGRVVDLPFLERPV
jgi:glycine cleavage system aminomethyltransferase T